MSSARVALITGGTRGIGLGIAGALAAEGWHLALCGRRPATAVASTVDDLRALVPVHYFAADVARREDREALVAAVRSCYPSVHALVNNAGMAPRVRADILETTEDSFEEVTRANLQGPYFLTQAIAKWMLEQGQGGATRPRAIVNVSSISADVASTDRGEYCIAKAGVAMATKLWAARLGADGILVYEVRPGIIRTDMTAAVVQKYDEMFRRGVAIQARWGLPEDVGRTVAALVRGDLPYSTGQVVMVDGGMSVARL
jgi:3-oxoacyl-[acyl-carrier protein] reductase